MDAKISGWEIEGGFDEEGDREDTKLVCKWKVYEVLEVNIQDDNIHMCLLIPPRYSISYVMSILKGTSSSWAKKNNKLIKDCATGGACGREVTMS